MVDSNQVIINTAITEKEKLAVYQLRYRVYSEEIQYNLKSADHKNKLLYDELDQWSIILYATVRSEVVGTLRVNIGKPEDFPTDVRDTYCMDRFRKFYDTRECKNFDFGLISKGIVNPAYRKLPIFTMLILKSFEMYCENRVDFGFVNCNFYLLPLQEHYGARRLGKNTVEDNYGVATSLVVLPNDVNYLNQVNSPFYDVAKSYNKTQDDRIVNWFLSEFPETAKTINSQLISKNDYWNTIKSKLGQSPLDTMPILKNLTEEEAKLFLYNCGVVVQCYQNDYISVINDVSQELHVLLSGQLYSQHAIDINKIRPGEHFGTNGLINRARHAISIISATEVNLLVLSYHYFIKSRRLYPNIAQKIINNLT